MTVTFKVPSARRNLPGGTPPERPLTRPRLHDRDPITPRPGRIGDAALPMVEHGQRRDDGSVMPYAPGGDGHHPDGKPARDYDVQHLRGRHVQDFVQAPIARTLLVFTLPVLGSTTLQALNGAVNAFWVGRFLGRAALTGTSIGNLVFFIILSAVFGGGEDRRRSGRTTSLARAMSCRAERVPDQDAGGHPAAEHGAQDDEEDKVSDDVPVNAARPRKTPDPERHSPPRSGPATSCSRAPAR